MTTNKTYEFQAETWRILELLTHSIYSNKEIFLRELVSNASDAIDKARIKSLTDTSYLWDDNNFQIKIDVDTSKNILIIEDNWIWMSEEEVIKNIWTIAKSGTKDFLDKIKEAKENLENNLIGQFWVWFYSSFLVAEKVELETKSSESDSWVLWISVWKWSYEIKNSDKKTRGTILRLYLKEENREFLENWKLRELVKKYSNYVPVPIMMKEVENENNKDKEKSYEQINETKAIWNKNKSEVSVEEYSEFYSSLSYDFNKPLTHIHASTEWMISYKSILFIPNEKNMFGGNDDPNKEYWPKLYVKNILILEHAKDLLPIWLRFISGVVETSDLPLNISREMLQSNTNLEKIKKWLVKKVIEKLKSELKENTNYDKFLENFGRILKEWIYYDGENKEKIAEVIKFKSLLKWKNITLDEYLEEFKVEWEKNNDNKKDSETSSEWQKENSESQHKKNIYYITAKSESEALINPYLEQFRENKVDVLLLTDPIDEWIVSSLTEYKEVKLVSITSSDINLESEKTPEEKEKNESDKRDFKDLLELIKNTVWTDKLEEVKLNDSLWSNIWALKTKTWNLTPQMEKMMKAMWQQIPTSKRIFEINPKNDISKLMLEEFKKDLKSEKLKDLIKFSYEQAILLEGWEVENMKEFLDRVGKFIK